MLFRPLVGCCAGPWGYVLALATILWAVIVWQAASHLFGILPLFIFVHVATILVVLLTDRRTGVFALAVGTAMVVAWLYSKGLATEERNRIVLNIFAGLAIVGVVGRVNVECSETKFLLAELEHRTGNLLMTIIGLARRTIQDEADRNALIDRIAALGRIGTLLDGHAPTNLASFIPGVLQPFVALGQVEHKLEFQMVDAGTAKSLGLALHEMATNAMKHGALKTPHGKVLIHGMHLPGPRYSLAWLEVGGPKPLPAHRVGLGTMVIRQAEQATGGRMEAELLPGGLRWKLEFPVSRATVH